MGRRSAFATEEGYRYDAVSGSRRLTREWRHFDFRVSDGVAVITLNRPDKLNPLTFDSYADLRDLFGELPLRGDVRSVIITGQGKGFCSGGDVHSDCLHRRTFSIRSTTATIHVRLHWARFQAGHSNHEPAPARRGWRA